MHKVAFLAILLLGFMAGAVTMHFNGPTANYFRDVVVVARQASSVMSGEDKSELPPGWMGLLAMGWEELINPPLPDFEPGVRVLNEGLMQPGLTLYTPVYPWEPVRLIDAEGSNVHEWRLPDVFNDLERLDSVVYPRNINPAITDMHVYPSGNLLVLLGNDLGRTPYGYAVAMLDKNSNLLWAYTKEAHHQLDVAEDGRIAVMLNRRHDEHRFGYRKIELPFLDEEIVILSPDGEELQTVSLLKSFHDSEWQAALQFASPDAFEGDIFHLNAAKFLTARQAAAIPNVEEGDLLLSIRDMNVVAVLSIAEEKIVWVGKGPWYRQHDPQITPEGTLLVFDNHGELNRERGSRVVEVDPIDMGIVWEWPGDSGVDMYTTVMGSLERLPNGNTLIAESNRGRIIEVTRDGEVVWEYVTPTRFKLKKYKTTKVWHPQRVDATGLTFLGAQG